MRRAQENSADAASIPRPKELTRFFLAGAPKAGTTALYRFVGQHPQVFMCPIKEPSFFAAGDLLALEQSMTRAGVQRMATAVERWVAGTGPLPRHGFAFDSTSYEALFAGVRDELAIGEGSTVYFSAPGAPGAIHERYPGARFILMLRDPADRLFSQYRAMKATAPSCSYREWLAAVRACAEKWSDTLDFGRYATNLRRFFNYFPRHQFSIHLYEDFCADPQAVCRRISRFLGVDPDYEIDTSARINAPVMLRWPMLEAARQAIMPRSFAGVLPARWREALRSFYRKPRSREALDPANRRALIDHYRDEILETSVLIGRDLSSWLR